MSDLNKNSYIIVNYHYIHDLPASEAGRGVYPCSLSDFDKQVRELSQKFKIVSVPDLYKAAQSGVDGKFCAITFDDGLRDHFDNAIPILKKYGAFGTFFIITSTFDGKVPVAHKLHQIRSRLSIPDLIKKYNEFMPDRPIPTDAFIDKNERYDDVLTSNFKTTISRLPREEADNFLAHLISELGWKESEMAKKLFITPEEVRKMSEAGMEIGAHSDSHDSLAVLSEAEVERDVVKSMKVLTELLGKGVPVFSYPHGQFKPERLAIFEKAGFCLGVTTERRSVSKEDRPMTLPRYDTNDVSGLI